MGYGNYTKISSLSSFIPFFSLFQLCIVFALAFHLVHRLLFFGVRLVKSPFVRLLGPIIVMLLEPSLFTTLREGKASITWEDGSKRHVKMEILI
jgi:hypothetical protein